MRPLRIAIVGLGLIGGSMALALKEALAAEVELTGLDNGEAIVSEALQRQIIDRGAVSFADIGEQDIVFICTPVLQMLPVLQALIPFLSPGTVITDVGSTKQHLSGQLLELIPDHISYIGGHPMAGREKSGLLAADKNLFVDKWYILTQGIHATEEQYRQLAGLLKKTGAKVTRMDAADHDSGAALMSHIPHVAAAALVNVLLAHDKPEHLLTLMGGGFRDTTRIASSDADMWSDICLTNKAEIAAGLRAYGAIIDDVVKAIETDNRENLHLFFSTAKRTRNTMLAQEEG